MKKWATSRFFAAARRMRYTQSLSGCGILLHACRATFSIKKSLGAQFHAEAHISTESPQPLEDPRVSQPHEDQERSSRIVTSPRPGPQARLSERRLPRLVSSLEFGNLARPESLNFRGSVRNPLRKEFAFYEQRQSVSLCCRAMAYLAIGGLPGKRYGCGCATSGLTDPGLTA